jgi:hypothetical protein
MHCPPPEGGQKQIDVPFVAFYQNVMIPLLGSCYLKQSVIYRLDSSQVYQISQQLQNQRPGMPVHKKDIFEIHVFL